MTFIEVRHGANESQVFNSDCYLAQILESVKKHCDCKQYDELMLMDEATPGNQVHLTKLTSSNPLQNGSSVFKERGKYILMAIDKSSREKKRPVYKPLLYEDYIGEEVSELIKALSQPDLSSKKDRHSSLSKKRSKSKLSKSMK